MDKREKASLLNAQKQQKHAEIIKSLENQNKILQELLKIKHSTQLPFDKLHNYDVAFLKKIIFKQEKRLR